MHRTKHNLTKEELVSFLKEQCSLGRTLKQIGEDLGGLSRERIRQLLVKFKITPGFDVRHKARVEAFEAKRTKKDSKDHFYKGAPQDVYEEAKIKFRQKKSYIKNKMGQPWEVAFQDVDFPEYCPILGIPLNYFADTRCDESVSIAIVDKEKGWVSGNVLVCSLKASHKKDLSIYSQVSSLV